MRSSKAVYRSRSTSDCSPFNGYLTRQCKAINLNRYKLQSCCFLGFCLRIFTPNMDFSSQSLNQDLGSESSQPQSVSTIFTRSLKLEQILQRRTKPFLSADFFSQLILDLNMVVELTFLLSDTLALLMNTSHTILTIPARRVYIKSWLPSFRSSSESLVVMTIGFRDLTSSSNLYLLIYSMIYSSLNRLLILSFSAINSLQSFSDQFFLTFSYVLSLCRFDSQPFSTEFQLVTFSLLSWGWKGVLQSACYNFQVLNYDSKCRIFVLNDQFWDYSLITSAYFRRIRFRKLSRSSLQLRSDSYTWVLLSRLRAAFLVSQIMFLEPHIIVTILNKNHINVHLQF